MKNEKKLRLPLAHTAFMLYSVAIAHFLTTVTFHFSVDHLIDALVRLAFNTVSLIVLVAASSCSGREDGRGARRAEVRRPGARQKQRQEPGQTTKARSRDSLPSSRYSAPGGLRQGPRCAAESPA